MIFYGYLTSVAYCCATVVASRTGATVWNRPGAITDAYAESVRAFIQVGGHGQQCTIAELDALIAALLEKLVGFDE